MDWKRLDSARSQVGPIEVDLIEAYAHNKISRRNFVKRGTIVGLSAPMMASIIAACGGSDGDDGGGAAASTTQETEESAPAPTEAPATPVAGGEITVGIQTGDANSGLDPLNMLDLGTYGVTSQSFEYLVGLGDDGNIAATGLATAWSPNADGTAWTFNLREGVLWHDGTPLTSADVAGTFDRVVAAGILGDIATEGNTDTPDDLTVVFNLDKANGNLPVLMSIFQAQALVTPADYSNGTTLDARPAGTGPWVFESHDPTTFTTTYNANEDYWGGRPVLDKITLRGFDTETNRVAAMSAREIDMIQSFSVVDGSRLLGDDSFEVLSPPSSNHRQVYFNTQLPEGGPFTDARVRRAIGYCLDREQMVQTLFDGRAIVHTDHPVHPTLPFFDGAATPQRPRDIEMAKALLAEAGVENLTATIQAGDIQASPDMAAIIEQNCAEAGITLSVNVTANADFYGEHWCAGAEWGALPETGGPTRPCGASSEIGICDWGHRPIPDVFLTRALQTDGDWNGSNYTNPTYDNLVTEYQAAVDVDGQKKIIGEIQEILHEDSPALYPFFFDYLAGHDSSLQNVRVTALGHMDFSKATKSA